MDAKTFGDFAELFIFCPQKGGRIDKDGGYQVCVGETDAAVVQGRASVVSRTSLSCATRTCGKRSSSASVLVRTFSVRLFTKPRASSAMMNGWITMFPWLRCLRNSLFPERRWSIQIDVSARINSAAPCGVEYSSIAALCLPGTPICERFPAR